MTRSAYHFLGFFPAPVCDLHRDILASGNTADRLVPEINKENEDTQVATKRALSSLNTVTRQECFASLRQSSRPIPEAPPVTMADFPLSCMLRFFEFRLSTILHSFLERVCQALAIFQMGRYYFVLKDRLRTRAMQIARGPNTAAFWAS